MIRLKELKSFNKKIVDSFIFYNELSLLNMRLHELYDYVDYFILVESSRTFTDNEKPLFYGENKKDFEKFQDKIIHVVVDDMPKQKGSRLDPWRKEHHQRNAVARGINSIRDINEHDMILVSDVDEIPNPLYLKQDTFNEHAVYTFKQRFFYYNFSCEDLSGWHGGTIAYPYKIFQKISSEFEANQHTGLSLLRGSKNRKKWQKSNPNNKLNVVPASVDRESHGGWHCSFFGGVDKIITKIESFSHENLNTTGNKDKDKIKSIIKNKKDLFGRGRMKWTHNDEGQDLYLPEYKDLAYEEDKRV